MKSETERGLAPLRETLGGVAMSYKLALAGAMFAGAVTIGSAASAATITLDVAQTSSFTFMGGSFR